MLGKLLQGRYQVVQILSVEVKPTLLKIPLATTTAFALSNISTSNDPDSLETLRQLFTREAQALEKLGNYDQIPQLLAHFEENLNFTWYKIRPRHP